MPWVRRVRMGSASGNKGEVSTSRLVPQVCCDLTPCAVFNDATSASVWFVWFVELSIVHLITLNEKINCLGFVVTNFFLVVAVRATWRLFSVLRLLPSQTHSNNKSHQLPRVILRANGTQL